jgi:hypothetical protein
MILKVKAGCMEGLSIQLDKILETIRWLKIPQFKRGYWSLQKKLVEIEKHATFPTVFLLLKLALIFRVATTTIETTFSAMKIIKTDLRNRIGDYFFITVQLTMLKLMYSSHCAYLSSYAWSQRDATINMLQ